MNTRLSAFDLAEISRNERSVEEAFARTLSFQNIHKILVHYKELDKSLDLSAPLKKPYHNRNQTLLANLDTIFERRHAMVHRKEVDPYYDGKTLKKDIKNVKVSIERVYLYICQHYGWDPQDIAL